MSGLMVSTVRAEDAKLCALVIIGVNERGEKHFLAIEDGVRESTQSWREVLLNLKSRGMSAPQLAIGDGAMGFWAALDEIFPASRQQRCWMHKTMNVLNCLPKSAQPKAKQALHAIWQAETKDDANKAFDLFMRSLRRNTRKRRAVCSRIGMNCWHFMIFRPNTRASGPATRLNPPLPPSATGPKDPKVV